jgi:hypothetical protein
VFTQAANLSRTYGTDYFEIPGNDDKNVGVGGLCEEIKATTEAMGGTARSGTCP